MIPRWRSYEETMLIGELDPPRLSRPRPWSASRKSYDEHEKNWIERGGWTFAAELIGSAAVLGATPSAVAAAEEVLTIQTGQPLLEGAARRLLERTKADAERERILPATPAAPTEIKRFRASLRRNPRNAIRWCELARHHTIAGHHDKALRAIQVARTLAPYDRYVLRSAARFEIHRRNPDIAASMLTTVAAQTEDPWLVAAALGAAGVAGVSSTLVRCANRLLVSGRHVPLELGELASALGTIEAREGNDREARRLFRQALEDPTDNAVAQAEWASRHVAGVPVPAAASEQPESWEARAWVAAGQNDHVRAVEEAWRWYFDQPFACRPAEFGSYYASIDGGYDAGAEIARAGLRANPDDFLLLNNLAFCLASSDRELEAEAVYSRVRPGALPDGQLPTYLATRGLIAFRLGQVEEGRYLYAESTARWGEGVNRAIATIMLAREELRIRSPRAAEAEERARLTSKAVAHGDLKHWLRHLDAARRVVAISPTLAKGAAGHLPPTGDSCLELPPAGPRPR